MKVLLVHQAYPPTGRGGSDIYTEALALELVETHDVSVLYRSKDPARPDYDLREGSRRGIRTYELNNLQRQCGGFEAYRDRELARTAASLLDALQPEVVHVGGLSGLSTGIAFEARRRGAALVITLHDFGAACVLGQLVNTQLQVCPGPTPRRCLACVGAQVASRSPTVRRYGRHWRQLEPLGRWVSRLSSSGTTRIAERLEEMRELLRCADALIAPSRFVRDRMVGLGFPAAHVLPYGQGALPTVLHRPAPDGRVRFGFIGSAIPSKGVHVLASAFRELDDARAELRIHGEFVPYHGDVSYEARIREILGASAEATLRGAFAHSEVSERLAELDVLVVPSVWEENAPLVVHEAFRSRVPVVVSGHGGLAEMVSDGGGMTFRPGDSRDLARVLARFLDEPTLANALRASAPAVPTMMEHVGEIERVYEQASARRTSRSGRVGVVVLDHGRPEDASVAIRSVWDDAPATDIVLVQNGIPAEPPGDIGVDVLSLEQNLGFGGGMNAGLRHLQSLGCDRFLLLNNDAVLAPGCLQELAEALDEPTLAAVGPVILRQADSLTESCGVRFDPLSGRHRLEGHGRPPQPRAGQVAVQSLSGAVMMLSGDALDRVGPLDEGCFLGFEDTDWCLRARGIGLEIAVVLHARASHAGSRTLGRAAPVRLYYAARNHVRVAERRYPQPAFLQWSRRLLIAGFNVAHAVIQSEVPRFAAVAAALRGTVDGWRGRAGPAQGAA